MSELRGAIHAPGALTGTVSGPEGLSGRVGGGAGGGIGYRIGSGLKVVENTLMVDAADAVEEDNTRPVTSAAVYLELGNIEALLANI